MTKARSRRDANLRQQIAYQAARLIAEDGVADYGAAKQKAARQVGVRDNSQLPDNHEIETALRDYQGLYQADVQPRVLRRLREVAVRVMREFESFRPYLVGPVLSGTAGAHSEVNIHLFPDDAKALMLFLLNRAERFEDGTQSVPVREARRIVPKIGLDVDGVPVSLLVFEPGGERGLPGSRRDGEAARASRKAVEALLDR